MFWVLKFFQYILDSLLTWLKWLVTPKWFIIKSRKLEADLFVHLFNDFHDQWHWCMYFSHATLRLHASDRYNMLCKISVNSTHFSGKQARICLPTNCHYSWPSFGLWMDETSYLVMCNSMQSSKLFNSNVFLLQLKTNYYFIYAHSLLLGLQGKLFILSFTVNICQEGK